MKKPLFAKIFFVLILIFLGSSLLFLFFADVINYNFSYKSLKSEESYDVLTSLIVNLEEGNKEEVLSLMITDNPNLEEEIDQVISFLEENPIEDYEIIDVHKTFVMKSSGKTINIHYELQTYHKSNYGVLTAETITEKGVTKVKNFHIQAMNMMVKEANKFYKKPFGLERTILLLVYCSLIGFVIFTILHYYRHAEILKWWRILLLSLSFFSIIIDWNTINFSLSLLSFSFAPTSLSHSGNVGIWQMKLNLPLFSILYWLFLKRKYLGSDNEESESRERVDYNKSDHDKFIPN